MLEFYYILKSVNGAALNRVKSPTVYTHSGMSQHILLLVVYASTGQNVNTKCSRRVCP